MKKIKKIILLLVVFSFLLSVKVSAEKVDKKDVQNIYKSYVSNNLSDKKKYPYANYTLYDINKDGVDELFFEYMSGVRSGFQIYTYRNKKVTLLKAVVGVSCIYYNKKQICILTSGGAADNTHTFYTCNGKKLVKGKEYKSSSSTKNGTWSIKYYENGKSISKKRYLSVTNPIDKWKRICTYK